jgi:hypothetical protein
LNRHTKHRQMSELIIGALRGLGFLSREITVISLSLIPISIGAVTFP